MKRKELVYIISHIKTFVNRFSAFIKSVRLDLAYIQFNFERRLKYVFNNK